MKKPAIVLLLLLITLHSFTQKIKSYEYWVDDDVSAKVVTAITPVKNLHLQQALAVTQASYGLHVFNIRFADTTNTWSSIVSQFFVKNPSTNSANRQIVGYEYWFDDVFTATTYQQVDPSAQLHMAENLNLNALSYGMHVLNIRFKDDMGSWSSVISQFFVYNPPTNSANRQIVGYEYWTDNLITAKTYQQVAPSSQFHLTGNLSLNSVSYGFHVINIRFKDDVGNWSGLITQFFTRDGTPVILPNKTVSYRFWFDNDPATLETFSLPEPTVIYNLADTIETPFLTVGSHTFNYQFKDSNHVLSSIRTDTFSVTSCLPHGGRIITGATDVCVGQAGIVYSIRKIKNASGYSWTVPVGASIVTGANTHSVTVDFSMAAASGNVTVFATNPCGTGTTMIFPVTVHQLPQPTLTGEDTVCSGTSGLVYITETGKSNYAWAVSPGNSITTGGTPASPTATVSWSSPGPQWIRVNYSNEFGCRNTTDTQFDLFVKQSPVPSISGLNSLCIGTENVVYTTQTGMTNYSWSISAGGTIMTGGSATDNMVTVTWNTTGAKWVKVNYHNQSGCPAITPAQYNVVVNALPVPTLSGSSNACLTTPVSYSTQSGMTNYTWLVSPGGTVLNGGTPSSYFTTINWTTLGPKSVSVNYTNSNGCTAPAATVRNLSVYALPVPVITGTPVVCKNTAGNQYSTETGMTGYTWTVSPGGTIVGSSSSSFVNVTWNNAGNQYVRVNYANANGCRATSATQFNVTVNPFPAAAGSVTGPAEVIQGQSGAGYSVGAIAQATGYTWSLPQGATIVAGNNTASVVVDFSESAISGNVSVHGTNGCGSGEESPILGVQVIPTALSLENVEVNNGQARCYNAVQTIYVAGSGTTFVVQNGGSATMIAGQNILYRPAIMVVSGGYMHGYITTTGQYCGAQPPPLMAAIAGQGESMPMVAGSMFRVFPNPTTGSFTLVRTDLGFLDNVGVIIYNMQGEKLLTCDLQAEPNHAFSLANRPPGIYILHILNGSKAEMVKIIRL